MDYKSKRWLHLRDAVLRRDKYRCREAARFGRNELATVAHHVYPVEDFPGWQWCGWNLIAVHNSFHDRVTGKLTDRGLAWQRRVIPPPDAPPPF